LPELFRKFLPDQAREQVVAASRSKPDDDADGPRWISIYALLCPRHSSRRDADDGDCYRLADEDTRARNYPSQARKPVLILAKLLRTPRLRG
jgi:hypothetical protein